MKTKRTICIAFLLVVCILLGSCKTGKQPDNTTPNPVTTTELSPIETPSQTPAESTPAFPAETTPKAPEESSSEPPEITPPENSEDLAYLDIPIKKPAGFAIKDYAIKNSSIALMMKFYLNWEHVEDGEGGYLLMSNGKEIGHLMSGAAEDVADWKTIYQKDGNPKRLDVTEYLERYGTGETLRFRHRFCYRFMECGKEQLITLTINYGEINEYLQKELRENVMHREHCSDPMYGALAHLQDKPLLVLGNSFIPSSSIVYIYNDIAQSSGKNQVMYGQSRGYVGTYARDTELMNRIANGEWGAVFICGFYNIVIDELGVIKRACEKSGTELIIFPAHNESDVMIDQARGAYPDLFCINWKREVDQLINEGRSRWDFCVDDGHMHSTPLAGYVGAMMIWRAIYGEMPDVKLTKTSAVLNQEWADSILGEYLESPTFELMDPSKILFLE